jgi:hypothetical protein
MFARSSVELALISARRHSPTARLRPSRHLRQFDGNRRHRRSRGHGIVGDRRAVARAHMGKIAAHRSLQANNADRTLSRSSVTITISRGRAGGGRPSWSFGPLTA